MPTSVSVPRDGTPVVSLKTIAGLVVGAIGLIFMVFGLFVMGYSTYTLFWGEVGSQSPVIVAIAFFVGCGITLAGCVIVYFSMPLLE